jgi:hypothetical protein
MTVFSLSGRLLTSPIKIFGICAAIVGACASITAHAQDDNIAKVVATIDGEDISLNLVIAMMRQLPPQYRDQPFDVLYDPVLDDIIDTRLAAREAKRSGIADDPLIQELAQRAYDRVMAEAWISINIQQQITDDMVDARYAELINDTSAREEISARHILVDSMDAATDIIRRLMMVRILPPLPKHYQRAQAPLMAAIWDISNAVTWCPVFLMRRLIWTYQNIQIPQSAVIMAGM